MTAKGFFKGALAAAGIGTLVVYGPVALLAFAGALMAGRASEKILMGASSTVLQKLRLIKSNREHPAAKGERLTKGEIDFAESIFGIRMQAERVRKYFSANGKGAVHAETYGPAKVKFFGANSFEADYSKAQNLANAWNFMQQMTHVFQAQNKGSILRQAFRKAFRSHKAVYELSVKSRFDRFGDEQQASIIRDYTRQFLYRDTEGADLRTRDEYLTAEGSIQKLSSLKKVVEARFPQARKAKLAIETQRNGGAPVKPEAIRFPIVCH